MRTITRSTRRTTLAQPLAGKENHSPSQQENVSTPSPRKARNRLSTAVLARLEDVFKQNTHPSRQQKRDLATELELDYKTITIWFQNKRQMVKRSQPPADRADRDTGRSRADSRLRAVSSPSHNATLDDTSAADPDRPTQTAERKRRASTIAARAISKIRPLLDSLNAMMSRPRGYTELTETETGAMAPDVVDVDARWPQTSSENVAESSRHDQIAEQEQIKEKPVRRKRLRTLEWACERQAKRRKLSKEAYSRLGSEEVEDQGEPNNTRMDSALSLLSLASSTQVGPPRDVIRGASLLLSFKHSWRRK